MRVWPCVPRFTAGDVGNDWNVSASVDWSVSVHHSWVKGFHRVKSINRANRTMMFTQASLFAFGDYVYCSERRYFIENVAELPLTPGSWRCVGCGDATSTASVLLEYLPTDEEAAAARGNSLVVSIPSVETLLYVGASGITVKDLVVTEAIGPICRDTACDADLAAMANGAITVGSVANVTIVNVTIVHVGGIGVRANNAPGLFVSHVGVFGAGAGGLFLASCPGALVNNSIVRGFGQRHRAASGVHVTQSPFASVDHNEITEGFSNGLTGGGKFDGGVGTSFDSNLVHGNGWAGDDGICDYGGIHLGTTGSVRPTHITNNAFWNITAYNNGGSGIYMDVSSTAIEVRGNLVHSTAYAPIEWHINPGVSPAPGAAPTRIINNVFVSSGTNAYYTSKGGAALYWDGLSPSVFEHNVVVVNATTAPQVQWLFTGVTCARDFPSNASSTCTSK